MRVDPKTLQGALLVEGDPLSQEQLITRSLDHYDDRPFPTDMDLVLAIRRRINAGCLDAAVGMVSQFRERLLYHPESQAKAKAHNGEGSTGIF